MANGKIIFTNQTRGRPPGGITKATSAKVLIYLFPYRLHHLTKI